MSSNARGLHSLLAHFEGLLLEAQTGAHGNLNVGFGHNITVNSPPYGPGLKITIEEALALLDHDIHKTWLDMNSFSAIKKAVKKSLENPPGLYMTPRTGALVSIAYNIGATAFDEFNTFLAYCTLGQWEAAAADLIFNTLWAKQVPERAKETAAIIELNCWSGQRDKR
jgi:GH24 family phage-related lysozyme (muramidase)